MLSEDIDDFADIAINEFNTDSELLAPIYGTHIYYNSVNIFVGRQGSGKTFTCLKEIAKISSESENTHLLIYITKNGDRCDKTFEALKQLIEMPIHYVAEQEAEGFVTKLLENKALYNEIKEHHLERRVEEEQANEILEALFVKDFSRSHLHTLILFEDSANSMLLKRPQGYFNRLVARCRHEQVSCFFCVQFWKSLPTELKSNVVSVFIFPNFSKQQLSYILQQVNTTMPLKRLYEAYTRLRQHECFYVNTLTGNISIV
jgi:Cdc6-like AAA superfamily ATPase